MRASRNSRPDIIYVEQDITKQDRDLAFSEYEDVYNTIDEYEQKRGLRKNRERSIDLDQDPTNVIKQIDRIVQNICTETPEERPYKDDHRETFLVQVYINTYNYKPEIATEIAKILPSRVLRRLPKTPQ